MVRQILRFLSKFFGDSVIFQKILCVYFRYKNNTFTDTLTEINRSLTK